MASKEEIFNQVKQDNSEIYGQRIFDIFIQLAELSLAHYKQLDDKQKNLANTFYPLKEAAKSNDVEALKDLIVRESRKNPGKNLVIIVLGNSQDKETAEKLLIENKKLNWDEIEEILKRSQNLKRTIDLLGEKNMDIFKSKITHPAFLSEFLHHINDKKTMIEFLGHDILDNLNAGQVIRFIYWNPGETNVIKASNIETQKERINLLGKSNAQKAFEKEIELNKIFKYDWSLEEVVEYFGIEVLNVIDNNNINNMIRKSKDREKAIELIVKNKNNYYIPDMIHLAKNKNNIIKLIGREKIQNIRNQSALLKSDLYYIIEYNKKNLEDMSLFFKYLSSDQVEELLKELKQSLEYFAVAKLMINNRELSQKEIFNILYYAYYNRQKELIEELGEENIKKLNEDEKRKIIEIGGRSVGGKAHMEELKKLLN